MLPCSAVSHVYASVVWVVWVFHWYLTHKPGQKATTLAGTVEWPTCTHSWKSTLHTHNPSSNADQAMLVSWSLQ
eukprot:1577421-Amphidinium_carterae.2